MKYILFVLICQIHVQYPQKYRNHCVWGRKRGMVDVMNVTLFRNDKKSAVTVMKFIIHVMYRKTELRNTHDKSKWKDI